MMPATEREIWYAIVRNDCSRRVHHICVMSTNDGRMVASKMPRKIRAVSKPAKLVAAAARQCPPVEARLCKPDSPVQMVTIDHAAMLKTTQYLTGKTTSAYAEVDWKIS